jgi:GT2 family glycosyltransferase
MDTPALETVSLIIPFYRNSAMLAVQLAEINKYPAGYKIIIVDDGSPEPAEPIVREHLEGTFGQAQISLYRIDVDIPWNREGARNLGATVADTPWIIHVDIDHLLAAPCAEALLKFRPDPSHWYRFGRFRCGAADETRQKDQRKTGLPDDATYGRIHEHIDSYLMTRELYWKVGGYDEDYSGVLGGGNAFLTRVEQFAGKPVLAPEGIELTVFTRSVVKDASDWACSRDGKPGKDLWKRKVASGDTAPKNPLRFPWTKVL